MKDIALTIPVAAPFLPVAAAFTEKGTAALGLAADAVTAITIAVEEVLSYLCGMAGEKQTAEIRCADKGYYVLVEVVFTAKDLNIRAFNMTAVISLEDESSLEEMGLVIASRLVDRLNVRHDAGGRYVLQLIKEKLYPEPVDAPLPPTPPLEVWDIKTPNTEELKLLSRLVRGHYQDRFLPRAFMYPGKVADMVGCGEYRAAMVTDAAGHIGGGIFWHALGENTVECIGPYLFGQEAGSPLAAALVDHCLHAIAKTPAAGLINRFPTEALPSEYFERLGSYGICDARGTAVTVSAYYRQLHEDPGRAVWAHAALEDFLHREYERLVLPRNVRLVDHAGEAENDFSVFSVDFKRPWGVATLHPVQFGKDAGENLANHVRLLGRVPFHCIFFEMDIGIHWQADFIPALLAQGFAPRLILPDAGQGDIVLFQRELTTV